MRQVLAEMSVISDVAAVQYGDGSHGGTPDRSPRGPGETMGDAFWRRFCSAPGPVSRRAVLDDAVHALALARKRPPGPVEVGSDEWRLLVALDQRHVLVVAKEFGLSARQVFRIRAMARAA
jgi:hypothetical protein